MIPADGRTAYVAVVSTPSTNPTVVFCHEPPSIWPGAVWLHTTAATAIGSPHIMVALRVEMLLLLPLQRAIRRDWGTTSRPSEKQDNTTSGSSAAVPAYSRTLGAVISSSAKSTPGRGPAMRDGRQRHQSCRTHRLEADPLPARA